LSFPEYLWIIDKDTYLNLIHIVPTLNALYPAEMPHAVAGSLVQYHPQHHNFTIPFGIVFTRANLQHWVKLLYCDENNKNTTDNASANGSDHFQTLACSRYHKIPLKISTCFEMG
jgi:hypothetical protein